MRIPKQEDFAILLMSELSRFPGQTRPLSLVSKTHGISPLFLKKIARSLKQAGLVHSREGIQGGYSLAKSPAKISVWEIIQAVGHQKSSAIKRRHCPLNASCLPQTINQSLADSLEKSLSQLTLANLVNPQKL